MMRTTTIIALALCLLTGSLSAQDQDSPTELLPRYGLFGGMNLALHTASFTALPGYPSCCPEYRFGMGLNPSVEAQYDLPLSSSLALSLRIGYDAWGADLLRSEETTVEQNGAAVVTTIEHEIQANIGTLGLGALLAMPFGDRLRGLAGIRTGYVLSADFTGEERLSDESTQGTFENGRRVRNEYAGDIPGAASLLAGISIGASYDLPLNEEETWLAVPELTATYGLLPVSSDVDWNAHSLRLGVAIMHAPRPTAPLPIIAAVPDPVPALDPVEEPVIEAVVTPIIASVAAQGVGADGSIEPDLTFRVEEFVAADTRPLLGYLFFDEGRSAFPNRYPQSGPTAVELFDPEKVDRDDPLAVQYRSLDIIGHRMTENDGARLTIVGTNDGQGEALPISAARAAEAKRYLVDRWKIDPDRITTSARGLPATPSNQTVTDGVAENRRVEFASNDRNILAPVRLVDTARYANPPTLRFVPTVTSGDVARWRLVAEQNGVVLKSVEGVGRPPASVDWALDAEKETLPSASGPMRIRLELTGTDGSTMMEETTVNVEQVTLSEKVREIVDGVEIERYNLVLFDFDKSDLTPRHRETVAAIAKAIPDGATVTVRGFTDRIGDPERNRELARERAEKVAAALGVPSDRLTIEATIVPPYDNDTPDGRYYSRTVQIEVRKREG